MAEVKMNLWYTRREGRIRGPYAADDVRKYILLGRIQLGDELSRDSREWLPVADCAELVSEDIRHPDDPEACTRLASARQAVDERRGGDRRATRRLSPPAGVERRGRDRRRAQRHAATSDVSQGVAGRGRWWLAGLLIVLAMVLVLLYEV